MPLRSSKNLKQWKGIPLTEEQQKDYREGKSVKLDRSNFVRLQGKNYPLKDGTTATMYLMFYPDKGQPFASKKGGVRKTNECLVEAPPMQGNSLDEIVRLNDQFETEFSFPE